MKQSLTTAVTAMALVLLHAGSAAAQTVPSLSVTAGAPNGVGATVTIEWSPLPLAQGYTVQVGTRPDAADVGTVNLPASLGTRIVVFAPNGTYYLRVRGFAGNIVGPYSEIQSVVVGGPVSCGSMTPPSVTAENSIYLGVRVNWTPVAGATSYVLEYSRFDSFSEAAEPAPPGVTSVAKYAGFTGSFFVRVVARDACGNAVASPYVPFTITNSPGTGPRTPDPPPGQLLPPPTYLQAVVQDMARRYAGPLSRACKNNHEFLYLLVRELRQHDSRWGLNWKRGDPNQGMSSDIVAYNPTDQPDEGNGRVYIFDVIGAECEGNYPNWQDQTAVTWAARGNPICGAGTWCTMWTLQPYLAAGGIPDGREQ